MSLLKKLFGSKFEPKTVEVEGIGAMSNDETGDWIGKIRITFLDKDTDLTIRAKEVSTTEVEFVKKIEREFENIHKELRKELFKDLGDFEDGTTMKQVFESLSFDHIYIHNPAEQEWELSATTEFDDHILNIQFSSFEYQGFSMDG